MTYAAREADRGKPKRAFARLGWLALALLLATADVRAEDDDAEDVDPRTVVIEVRDASDRPLADRTVRVHHVRHEPGSLFRFTRGPGVVVPSDFEAPLPDAAGSLAETTMHTTDAAGAVHVLLPLDRGALIEVDATDTHTGATAVVARGFARRSRVRLFVDYGRRVKGQLRLPDGTPTPGYVIVRSLPTRGFGYLLHRPLRPLSVTPQPTDAQGRFEATLPRSDVAWVDAFVPGRYTRRGVVAPHDPGGRFTIRMGAPDGAVVEGTVRDTEGKPMPGVRVVGLGYDPTWDTIATHQRVMAVTDEAGRYRLEGLDTGRLKSVAFRLTGYADLDLAPLDLHLAPGWKHRVDAVLQRAGTVRGRVTDTDGQPVPGAVVHLSLGLHGQRSADERNYEARADAEGRYALTGLPQGRGRIEASSPSAPRTALRALFFDSSSSGRRPPERGTPIQLFKEGASVTQDFTLPRGVPVEGWTVTPSGEPLPFVQVTASFVRKLDRRDRRDLPRSWSVTSDVAGRFRFQAIPPGIRIRLGTARTMRGSATPFLELHGDEPPPPVRVVIPDGTTVRGTVRDKEGAPLAGIPVSLEGTPQVTYTDPLGRYELSGLPRGASILRAGPASPRTRPYRVQVFDGKPVEAFDMVLPRGTTLRGQVVNAAGKPEPGFRVRVSQFAGLPHVGLAFVSDAHGRFEVTHLQTGKHTFIAGEAKKTVYVGEVGEVPPFTISPERAALRTLRGEVFAPDGRHVPFGRLHVLEGKNWRGEVHIVAGRFAISHQMLSKLGNVELIVTDALDFTGRQLDVGPTVHRIPAAAIDQDARLELTRGRAIDGTARDRSGAPAAGAVLELVMNDRSWWAQRQSYRTPTDDEGRFRFVGIPPDAEVLQVRVVHDDRYAPVQPTAVPAGASGVELTLTRAASIQGVVVERDGTPVRDARVVVWAAKGDVPYGAVAHDKTVTTDRDGRFEATGLHPDVRWWLRVRRVGQGASDYLVTLREGVLAGDAPVRLVLERAVAIHGRVELPEGRSIESFGVEAKPADANAPLSHRTTRARGGTTRFLLDELRPGRYRLTFDPGVAYKVPAPIEVDAPADDVVVKLEPALPVRGRLINGGHRRASLWLYMEPIDKRGRKPTRGSSDTSGNFVLPNELDAKGTILAKMGTELAAVLPDVHPDDGPFEIFLKPVVTVEGALENMPKALWDARRTVVLRVGALTYQARLAKDGTFRFRGLPAGTYRVELPMEGLDGAIEGKMEYTTGTGPLRLRYVVR